MPEKRFFLNTPFQKELVKLEGEEFHHLKVMRCAKGDIIELVNGKGQLAQATITEIQKNSAVLDLINITNRSKPTREIILAQSYLRPKNLDLVIEKGTELGATQFWLYPTERSEKEALSPNQHQRLEFLSISALKQCGRLDLPSIKLLPPLLEWKEVPPGDLYFGDLDASEPLSTYPLMTIFIGPEKGFSQKELNFLRNTLQAKGIRLNANVLRAETAAICALSIASSY